MHRFRSFAAAGALFAAAFSVVPALPARAAGEPLPELAVTSFPSPSTSFWFAALIPKLGLDEKHGFRLKVTAKPSQVAYADFVSGADRICYCIAPGAAARFIERGAAVSMLWNVQTYDHLIVTADSSIRTPKDLEGKTLGADTTTGSWAISKSLLARKGVDLSKVQIRSSPISANFAEISLGRIPALSTSTGLDYWRLEAKEPGKYRAVQIADSAEWERLTGNPGTPGWGLGAWSDYARDPANQSLLKKLYAASADLVALIKSDPGKVSALVESITGVEREPLERSFRDYWSFYLAPIKDFEPSIRLLGSQILPEGKVLDGPLTEAQYRILISDFQP